VLGKDEQESLSFGGKEKGGERQKENRGKGEGGRITEVEEGFCWEGKKEKIGHGLHEGRKRLPLRKGSSSLTKGKGRTVSNFSRKGDYLSLPEREKKKGEKSEQECRDVVIRRRRKTEWQGRPFFHTLRQERREE